VSVTVLVARSLAVLVALAVAIAPAVSVAVIGRVRRGGGFMLRVPLPVLTRRGGGRSFVLQVAERQAVPVPVADALRGARSGRRRDGGRRRSGRREHRRRCGWSRNRRRRRGGRVCGRGVKSCGGRP